MSIGIMGSKSLVLLDWGSRRISNKERERTNTCLCCFLHPRWSTLRFTQATVKSTITHKNVRHRRVSFSPFVTQPFSKRLYEISRIWTARMKLRWDWSSQLCTQLKHFNYLFHTIFLFIVILLCTILQQNKLTYITNGRFTRYDFVAYDKLTTGLRHEYGNRELTLKCKLKCYDKPMKDPLGVSPSKGIREPHEVKKNFLWPRWESNPRPPD